jgi:hypothetical protein
MSEAGEADAVWTLAATHGQPYRGPTFEAELEDARAVLKGEAMGKGRRECEEDAWGEAVYAAWCSGEDPDAVDRDRVAEDVDVGYDSFECGELEVSRQRCRRARQREADHE